MAANDLMLFYQSEEQNREKMAADEQQRQGLRWKMSGESRMP
jgi:hypothetical protein